MGLFISKDKIDEATILEPHDENISKPLSARTFRDGVRKIDLIIVLKDDEYLELEKHRVNFLVSIMKLGLEIELEPGAMPIHQNLVFVKVHAPDTVLYEYGYIFGFRPFKNIQDEILKECHDWKWINNIRNDYIGPLRYSSLKRSQIVYMIVLHVPFGERQNYIGVESKPIEYSIQSFQKEKWILRLR